RASHKRHVEARNRDDVIDPGLAHCLVDFFGNAGTHAHDQGRSNLSLWAADALPYALSNSVARRFNAVPESGGKRRRCRGFQPGIAEKEPAGADAGEIGVKGKVVATGPHRAAWRQEPDITSYDGTGPGARPGRTCRKPHPVRRIAQLRPLRR